MKLECRDYLREITHLETINGVAKEYADIDKVNGISKIDFRYRIAEIIKKNNLVYVNQHSKPVYYRKTVYSQYGKRVLDIILSGTALIILAPINTILAICTFFDVGWPIMFSQYRIGKDGKRFSIIKFRNMTNEKDENGELLPAEKRVTRFGRFVRKTSLDELLNFWSVFKGDMSIIGPRPLPEGYMDRFSNRHKQRHLVRPGLECPILKGDAFRSSWTKQFENDIYYVENISLLLDIKMCFALVRMTFDRKSSKKRGDSNAGTFMGYEKNGECINSHRVPVEYLCCEDDGNGKI